MPDPAVAAAASGRPASRRLPWCDDQGQLCFAPTLWNEADPIRNTWSWGRDERRPELRARDAGVVQTMHPELGAYWLANQGRSTRTGGTICWRRMGPAANRSRS